ncbi:hypothetical protein BUE76_14125 [Cnuella takakiae]|nr:hypothetical protein BUE76_14125 [Cnuella takakiae]
MSCLIQSCTTRDVDTNSMQVNAALTGANERPTPVATAATGTVTGTYFNITNQLTFTANWVGLSAAPIAMHFHGPATADQTAPPVVGITNFPANPTASLTQTITLTDAQEQQLMAGQWYFNIHTPNNPPGEIRGQVVVAP